MFRSATLWNVGDQRHGSHMTKLGEVIDPDSSEYVWLNKDLLCEGDCILSSDIAPNIKLPLSSYPLCELFNSDLYKAQLHGSFTGTCRDTDGISLPQCCPHLWRMFHNCCYRMFRNRKIYSYQSRIESVWLWWYREICEGYECCIPRAIQPKHIAIQYWWSCAEQVRENIILFCWYGFTYTTTVVSWASKFW